jgi:hypothetical protein
MPDTEKSRGAWRLALALGISALATLAALIAVRGPDWIGPVLAQTVGAWRLSGFSPWAADTLAAVLCEIPYAVAGPRGWQNAHIIVAWLSVLCWLVALPARAWRGLAPLAPALIAILLSSPAVGLSGFGLAILVLSAWHLVSAHKRTPVSMFTLPIAAWLAVWFSPGALPVVGAAALGLTAAWPVRARWAIAALCLAAVNLTPRGAAIWMEAWTFIRWSPQPPLGVAALAAVLVALVILGIAAQAAHKDGVWSRVVAPGFLFLCAAAGQSAYWWAGALWMIPCWPVVREHLQRFGFRIRWWMQAGALALVTALVAAAATEGLPRWYNLAMTEAIVRPTLTRAALPADGPVYLNPAGLALARFSGPLPARSTEVEAPNLGREHSLWRTQDRRVRYRAVWLLGDKSDYAPLARHLGESPDWRLAAADATGVLFVRGPREEEFATEPAKDKARAMIGAANRSGFLAATSLSCLAAQSLPEAGELSAAAVRRTDRSSAVAAAHARVLISLGQTREALVESERAIAIEPGSAEAWQVRAEALLHAGLNDEAYAAGRRVMELAPGDVGALWLAARCANAARAFQSEAAILEQLIALSEARGADAAFYQLYLGQSYARQGLTRPALRALQKAAEAPGLSDGQRRELEQEIADIRANPAAL